LIALQNLPEGFNAYRELTVKAGMNRGRVLWLFLALVVLGPAAGLLGFYALAGHDAWVGSLMLFAGGGILYLIFQDVAPQVPLRNDWVPPLGAVGGFLLGLLGQLLTGG